MKVWLTLEKDHFGTNKVMMWFDKPQKVYDRFIEKERWTLGEGAHFYYSLLTLEDVNYLVTEENSPLELDIPFLSNFIVEKTQNEDEKIRKVLLNDFKNNCSEYYCEGVSRDMIIAWLEKQGEKESDPRYEVLEDLLTADDIYQMSVNEAMVEEAKSKAVNALSKLGISVLLGLEKQRKKYDPDKVIEWLDSMQSK